MYNSMSHHLMHTQKLMFSAILVRGLFIPKDSIIVQNTWLTRIYLLPDLKLNILCRGLAMDKTVYATPNKFMPERFLVDKPPMDP